MVLLCYVDGERKLCVLNLMEKTSYPKARKAYFVFLFLVNLAFHACYYFICVLLVSLVCEMAKKKFASFSLFK